MTYISTSENENNLKESTFKQFYNIYIGKNTLIKKWRGGVTKIKVSLTFLI